MTVNDAKETSVTIEGYSADLFAFDLVRRMRAGDREAIVAILTEALSDRQLTAATVISLMKLADQLLVTYCPDPDAWLEAGVIERTYLGDHGVVA